MFRKFRASQNFMHKKVKNKTTVLNLVFKEFLQTSIPPLISVLYAKGYHDFPLKNLCLPVPRKIVGEPFCVSKEFWYRKVPSKGGGSFTVLSKIFSSHRTEKISPGNHSVFQKISGREKYFMDKGGYHDFPLKFLSHCTKIFHWRTIWCFRKILLSKISMHRRGGGEASRFC